MYLNSDYFKGHDKMYRGQENGFTEVLKIIGNVIKWILIILAVLILGGVLAFISIAWMTDSMLSTLALHVHATIAKRKGSSPPTDAYVATSPTLKPLPSSSHPVSTLYTSFNSHSTTPITK